MNTYKTFITRSVKNTYGRVVPFFCSSMKKMLTMFLFGLLSIVMCDCVSYKSSYPQNGISIVNGECESEAYLIQIFNLTIKDSLQVWIENKPLILSTMNYQDSMYFESEAHYYFNIAVWRKPLTKDYYVYSLNLDFNKYDIPMLFHKNHKKDIELCCRYKNRVYHYALNDSLKKCVLISVRQDSLEISRSNKISLIE